MKEESLSVLMSVPFVSKDDVSTVQIDGNSNKKEEKSKNVGKRSARPSTHLEHRIASDLTARFREFCVQLKQGSKNIYTVKLRGELESQQTVRILHSKCPKDAFNCRSRCQYESCGGCVHMFNCTCWSCKTNGHILCKHCHVVLHWAKQAEGWPEIDGEEENMEGLGRETKEERPKSQSSQSQQEGSDGRAASTSSDMFFDEDIWNSSNDDELGPARKTSDTVDGDNNDDKDIGEVEDELSGTTRNEEKGGLELTVGAEILDSKASLAFCQPTLRENITDGEFGSVPARVETQKMAPTLKTATCRFGEVRQELVEVLLSAHLNSLEAERKEGLMQHMEAMTALLRCHIQRIRDVINDPSSVPLPTQSSVAMVTGKIPESSSSKGTNFLQNWQNQDHLSSNSGTLPMISSDQMPAPPSDGSVPSTTYASPFGNMPTLATLLARVKGIQNSPQNPAYSSTVLPATANRQMNTSAKVIGLIVNSDGVTSAIVDPDDFAPAQPASDPQSYPEDPQSYAERIIRRSTLGFGELPTASADFRKTGVSKRRVDDIAHIQENGTALRTLHDLLRKKNSGELRGNSQNPRDISLWENRAVGDVLRSRPSRSKCRIPQEEIVDVEGEIGEEISNSDEDGSTISPGNSALRSTWFIDKESESIGETVQTRRAQTARGILNRTSGNQPTDPMDQTIAYVVKKCLGEYGDLQNGSPENSDSADESCANMEFRGSGEMPEKSEEIPLGFVKVEPEDWNEQEEMMEFEDEPMKMPPTTSNMTVLPESWLKITIRSKFGPTLRKTSFEVIENEIEPSVAKKARVASWNGLEQFAALASEQIRLAQRQKVVLDICMEMGILARSQKCPECTNSMRLLLRTELEDLYAWQCNWPQNSGKPPITCNIRRFSWLEGWPKTSLTDILLITECFVTGRCNKLMFEVLKLEKEDPKEWRTFFAEACIELCLTASEKIGGPGSLVELQEFPVGPRKYHWSRKTSGDRLLVGVDPKTKRFFTRLTKARGRYNLLKMSSEYILAETEVYSNIWNKDEENDEGFKKLAQKRALKLKNYETGGKIGGQDSFWQPAINSWRENDANECEYQGARSAEFIWRKSHELSEDQMEIFLEAMSKLYDINKE